MDYLRYCTITLVILLAGFTGACSVSAQDFSTVPDFPQDFTLLDPNTESAGSSSTTTKESTSSSTTTTVKPSVETVATPVTKTVPDTSTGPQSLKVITIATLLGFGVIMAVRFYKLTTFHEPQN